MKYRKRPIVIEATQWFPGIDLAGVSTEEVWAEIGGRGHGSQRFRQTDRHYVTTIHDQRVYLAPGDWVITESDGVHHYPCKPDEFQRIYEPV